MSFPLSFRLIAAAALAALPVAAAAESRAVVVANGDYDRLPDVAKVQAGDALKKLKQAGYRVAEGRDLNAADLRTALGDLQRPDRPPGQRIVMLNGRFVHSRGETWFLGSDAGDEGLAFLGAKAVPLSIVTELIEGGKPSAILLLGTDQRRFATGPGLLPGIGAVPARPGVTVISGYTDGIGRAAAVLAQPGTTVRQALRQGESLRLIAGPGLDAQTGGARPVVVPPSKPSRQPQGGAQPVVVPPAAASGVPVVQPPRQVAPSIKVVQPDADEQAAWNRAKRANSAAAYREFLGKYPSSIYGGAARGRIGN